MKRIHWGPGWMALAIVWAAIGCSREAGNAYQGYVEGEFVQVATSESGQLERLMVQRGGQVEAGAPLFALESEMESAIHRQAQGQLAAAEALLQDIQSGRRPQELDVIRAQLAQAETEAKRAEADWTRDEAQFTAGGIPQSQLDRSRAAAESSSARVRELSGQLAVAELPARDDQIKAQTAQVAAAKAAVEQAEWRLGQKTILAPVSGLVFDTLYREGEFVSPGRPVVRLLPPENRKVRFFVPETELGRLSIGQKVVLRCDGRAEDIPARVTYISTEAEFTPPIIYSNESRSKLVFMIEAKPAAAGVELHPGQPVQVRFK